MCIHSIGFSFNCIVSCSSIISVKYHANVRNCCFQLYFSWISRDIDLWTTNSWFACVSHPWNAPSKGAPSVNAHQSCGDAMSWWNSGVHFISHASQLHCDIVITFHWGSLFEISTTESHNYTVIASDELHCDIILTSLHKEIPAFRAKATGWYLLVTLMDKKSRRHQSWPPLEYCTMWEPRHPPSQAIPLLT